MYYLVYMLPETFSLEFWRLNFAMLFALLKSKKKYYSSYKNITAFISQINETTGV